MKAITIFTDGACRSNPGPGGWGVLVIDGTTPIVEINGYKPHSTNNEMELTAIHSALQWALDASQKGEKFSLKIVSDSQYSIKSITEWSAGWKKRGWRTSSGDPVKNLDLMKDLDTSMQLLANRGIVVTYQWVKGHSGNEYNERVDNLANQAIDNRNGSTRDVLTTAPLDKIETRIVNSKTVLVLESIISTAASRDYGRNLSEQELTSIATSLESHLHELLSK